MMFRRAAGESGDASLASILHPMLDESAGSTRFCFAVTILLFSRSIVVILDGVNRDEEGLEKRKGYLIEQVCFLTKYILIPFLWSHGWGFFVLTTLFYLVNLIETRTASYYRIKSNPKESEEIQELLDTFAPMWLNPCFIPESNRDMNTVRLYEKHKDLDTSLIQSGFERISQVKLPTRRTSLATETTWFQSCDFINQTFNYHVKLFVSLWNVGTKNLKSYLQIGENITANSIAEMLLNSDIGIFCDVQEIKLRGQEGVIITFDRGGFALPYRHVENCFDNRLRVRVFVPSVHEGRSNKFTNARLDSFKSATTSYDGSTRVSGAELLEFKINNHPRAEVQSEMVEIKDKYDMMNVLCILNANVCHPIVHSLNDQYVAKINFAAKSDWLSTGLSKIARYGNGFNDLAHFATHIIRGKVGSWSNTLVVYNSSLPIPFGHNHAITAKRLGEYSRMYSFLDKSHGKMKQAWQQLHTSRDEKGRLQVPQFGRWDFDVFFQLSANHSVGHFCFGSLVAKYDVGGGENYNRGFHNFANEVFYKSTIPQFLGSNLMKDNLHVPLFKVMYEAMMTVDPTIAMRVSAGISE